MKKSIAFLGALLFGSVTFAQVNKNDTINKSSSRKVSADDLKKLPPETETIEKSSIYMKLGDIKGERGIKMESQKSDYIKVSPDNAARIKGGVIQKGRESKVLVKTPEKLNSDDTTNPISNFKGGAIQKANADKSSITTEKQHYTIKMNKAAKAAQDSVAPKAKSTDIHLKMPTKKEE